MNRERNKILFKEGFFEKTYIDLSSEEVGMLFQHSYDVFHSLKNFKNVIVPEPLIRTDNAIKYTLYDLGEPLSEMVRAKNITYLVETLGLILKAIHSNGDLMHSDFVFHNLFVNDNVIYVIDSNPPALLGFQKELLYGQQSYDIYSLLYSIIDSQGLKKTLKSPSHFFFLARTFLKTYNYKFKLIDIRLLFRYIKIMYNFRKQTNRNQMFSFVNLSIVYILIVITLGLKVNEPHKRTFK